MGEAQLPQVIFGNQHFEIDVILLEGRCSVPVQA